MKEDNKTYAASLKSIETENIIDRAFYRPLGYAVTKMLLPLGISPNTVTIISIVIGASAGYFFHFPDITHNIYGILVLIIANILDCVDGQLARLTGKKTILGRILDGLAGDIWFLSIYTGLALRLSWEFGTYWFFAPALISGLSHLVQANITDYYKTLHLYFISKEKGSDFQSAEQVRRHKEQKPGFRKIFYLCYHKYTLLQEMATPKLQAMLHSLHEKYGDDFPEDIRTNFRQQSRKKMKLIELMTFNGRSIVLFIILFTEETWLYLLYETFALNLVLTVSIHKHERMCAKFS
ncbi:MAG: CDP-alcohol phosphatidyltransferase family protein [Tannerellaceae bacterium]|nr:CDP-alcohol phosphatidyltransferase family protein [Tannerellaceae bacterium]